VLLGSSAAIKPVAGDVDDVDPAMFLAVRTTRSVEPMTLVTSLNVEPVASLMFVQLAPAELHTCHW